MAKVIRPKGTNIVTDEIGEQLHCVVCGKGLYDINNEGHFAEIRRGYFRECRPFEGDDDLIFCENMKFNRFICLDCFMNDPDLCRFMNKIGCNLR